MDKLDRYESAKYTASLLKAIANENRLLLLCSLIESPKTATELAKDVFKISQPAVSQHLAELKSMGLITCEKDGRFMRYTLADERLVKLFSVLKEQFCEDLP